MNPTNRFALTSAAIAFFVLLMSGCAGSGYPKAGATPEDYFHWRAAENASAWAVFLPGSSGLTVFGDEHHYFDAAERLNDQGWNVILVDYKPAYRSIKHDTNRQTGEKIAWVTDRAIQWMREQHPDSADLPGALVAWSLGAEGALRIINDPDRAASMGLHSAVVYYPSNKDDAPLHNDIPLLILTGGADDVTRAEQIESLVSAQHQGSAPVDLRVYPDCHHGFDIASIPEKKTLRILPLVGPKATLQYNKPAADSAWTALTQFLDEHKSNAVSTRQSRTERIASESPR